MCIGPVLRKKNSNFFVAIPKNYLLLVFQVCNMHVAHKNRFRSTASRILAGLTAPNNYLSPPKITNKFHQKCFHKNRASNERHFTLVTDATIYSSLILPILHARLSLFAGNSICHLISTYIAICFQNIYFYLYVLFTCTRRRHSCTVHRTWYIVHHQHTCFLL